MIRRKEIGNVPPSTSRPGRILPRRRAWRSVAALALLLAGAGSGLRCARRAEPPRTLPSLDQLEVIHGERPDRTQARVLLVEFWAAWCMPCLMAAPHVNELYEKYQAQGLRVYGVAVQDRQTREEAQAAARELKMKYPVVWDADLRIALQYGIEGYPSTFLLDRQYRLLWEGSPFDLKESLLQQLLAEAPAP